MNRELPKLSPEDTQLIGNLQNDNLSGQALKKGERVGNFTLPDAQNRQRSLSTMLLNKKAVIVNFYRGMWCPFCNLELRNLQKYKDEFHANQVGIVAVSPQSPDNTLTTVEKHNLGFEVLSDLENKVAKQFGISFEVPDYLLKVYAGFGLDLSQYNEVTPVELPMPATYVIDSDLVVRHAFVQEDYTKRIDVNELREVVRAL